MLSNLTISFLLAAGSSAWIFSKMMHRTGNNTKSSLTIAAISAALILLLFTALLDRVFK